MGFAPDAVDAMSLWQFNACVDGWNAANGGEDAIDPPTADEFYETIRELG